MDRSMIAGRRSAVYDFKQRLCMDMIQVLLQAHLAGWWFVVLVQPVYPFIIENNICFG